MTPGTRSWISSGSWSEKTEIAAERFVGWIGISRGKYYDWRKRYGKANEHNALVPRDHWLTAEERQAIIAFHEQFPLEGYRRLTFMMIDQDVVAVSPSSVYRVLAGAGLLDRWNVKPSKKGTGFVQPLRPHEHWHIDVAYLNLGGTFYYLCSVLDGASRAIVHWEIREAMTEAAVECILQRAREAYPDERPRIISDNGPQFVAKDFKEFIRLTGMTHVRTSPYYPQSNGKIERWQSVPVGPILSIKRSRWWRDSSSTTTPSVFTARSATSRRSTSWPAGRPKSGRHGMPNSKPRVKLVACAVPERPREFHRAYRPPPRGGRQAVRTGRRIQSMAALVCGSGGSSRRMGGGGLDDSPLLRYEVPSIEWGGSSAHSNQPRTRGDTASCA